MPIDELIQAMQSVSPEVDASSVQGSSSRIAELIARARARKPERMSFGLDIDGMSAAVEFVEISGRAWSSLSEAHAPRAGSARDRLIGYDSVAVVRGFPVQSEWLDGSTVPTVLVDEVPVAQEQWEAFTGLLDAAALEDAAAVLWAIHVRIPRDRHTAALAAEKEGQDG
ncbi:hypothetical protein [Microbacterium sp. NPDC055357]